MNDDAENLDEGLRNHIIEVEKEGKECKTTKEKKSSSQSLKTEKYELESPKFYSQPVDMIPDDDDDKPIEKKVVIELVKIKRIVLYVRKGGSKIEVENKKLCIYSERRRRITYCKTSI